MIALKALGALVGLGLLIFSVLFLGGLASAAWEIRNEKRAGLVPTRPAWDNRDKRRALGGLRQQLAAAWNSARSRMVMCWCGIGPIQHFPALTRWEVEGWGCAAVEAGHPEALLRHDAAGGYARTPGSADAPPSSWDHWQHHTDEVGAASSPEVVHEPEGDDCWVERGAAS